MRGHPRPAHRLPPLQRDYEGSRLEAQQIIAAYELVIPRARQPVPAPDGPAPVRDLRSSVTTIEQTLAGAKR
jgi:hypothetical protein